MIVDFANWPLIFCNDEWGDVLVLKVWAFGAKGSEGEFGGLEGVFCLSVNDGVPTGFYHAPVCTIAICNVNHAATARGDLIIWMAREFGDKLTELLKVFMCGLRRNIATIENEMDAGTLDSLFLGLLKHIKKMVDVTVDIAVGKNTRKMQGRIVVFDVFDGVSPGVAIPNIASNKSLFDFSDSLFDDLARAEGVVADFGVAHGVWEDTDVLPGSLQLN